MENYSLALTSYKVLHNIKKIEKCFNNMMKSDPDNPKIREDYGDYFEEIGLHEKAKYYYFQAISLHTELL